ncbi:hypothetical protein F383_21046 [Gossypium arboreum]|uniref:Uncharacterized protein n=1 Tax=Gossypium arboreum TaxID=29729 RepID=A0A0B0NXL6_GOSAR|nr:hypothetical protein F383_21046 [Gossypium arboreum]
MNSRYLPFPLSEIDSCVRTHSA